MGTQLPQRGTAPAQLSTHVCCGQTAGWIKMPFGRKLVLRPGDIVLDGYQLPHKRGDTAAPTFGPCLSWPNDWVNQDATWYGGGSRPRPHCVRWGPSCPLQKRVQPQFSAHCGQTAGWIKVPHGTSSPKNGKAVPTFCPCLLWPNSCVDQDATCYRDRPRPRPHCDRWGPSSPKGACTAPAQ